MSHRERYRRSPRDASNLEKCGVPSSSVHPLEITVNEYDCSVSPDGGLDCQLIQNFRHSHWAAARAKVHRALQRCGASQKRLNRFRNCGSQPFVYRSGDVDNVYQLRGNYCHDKLCRPCAAQRSRLVTANLARQIEGRDIRFLTLTILDEGEDLTHVLTNLAASFRRLRAQPQWKTHVYGGCAFTEIKYNRDPDHWHVHLHMIIEGTYFPQSIIKELWRAASRGSFIVDIRPVEGHWQGAAEVAKYAGKPMEHTITFQEDLLDQIVPALDSKRLFTCFGKWRNFSLSKLPEKGEWHPVASLATLLERRRTHDIEATEILRILGIGHKADACILPEEPRPPPQPVSNAIRHTQTLLISSPINGSTPVPWTGRGLPF